MNFELFVDTTEEENDARKSIKLFDVDSEKPKQTSQINSTATNVQEVPKNNQKRKIVGTLSGITKTQFNAEYAVSGEDKNKSSLTNLQSHLFLLQSFIHQKAIKIPSN